MNIQRKIITKNYNPKGNIARIKYIVIHYFGALASAKSAANSFGISDRKASAHYCVDDIDIIQCVEDGDIAFHCGATTYIHPYCRNSNSLGIEVRPFKIDKSTASSAAAKDWYFTEKTIENTIEITKYLMKKYNIDADHVIRHHDVTGKLCPRPFVGDDINEYYGKSGNEMWRQFKSRLTETETEEEEMTGEQIYKALMEYMENLPTSEYAKESSKKGVASKVFSDGDGDGLVDNPQGILRRQELAVVLNRLGLLDK